MSQPITITDEAIAGLVERTRRASAVPPFVEDPAVLALIADVLLNAKAT